MNKIKLFLFLTLMPIMCVVFLSCNSSPTKPEEPAKEYFTVTYETLVGGEIKGVTEQIIEKGKEGTEVTAVPNEGFIFLNGATEILAQQGKKQI